MSCLEVKSQPIKRRKERKEYPISQTFAQFSRIETPIEEEAKYPEMMDKISKLGKRKITPNMVEQYDAEMKLEKK